MTDFLCASNHQAFKRKSSPSLSFDGDGAFGNSNEWKKRRYFCPQSDVTTEEERDLKTRPFFFDALIKEVETKRILEKKKLVLVLDLDHTLLHSTFTLPSGDNLQRETVETGVHSILIENDGRILQTKLRPLVHQFLKMVSALYEMYIYTHGNLEYATTIKNILDPDDMYFKNKVITKEDSLQRGSEKTKHMDLIRVETNMIVVIDDKPSKWVDHPRNLIHIRKYFRGPGDDRDDTLFDMYLALHKIHSDFYHDSGRSDVREVMGRIRRDTLKDCRLIFSNWKKSLMALTNMMGGVCCKEISDKVTHVVVGSSASTDQLNREEDGDVVVNWALENGKFLVSEEWLESAYYTWEKPLEKNFFPLGSISSSPLSPPSLSSDVD